jgi:hypothetical protein
MPWAWSLCAAAPQCCAAPHKVVILMAEVKTDLTPPRNSARL